MNRQETYCTNSLKKKNTTSPNHRDEEAQIGHVRHENGQKIISYSSLMRIRAWEMQIRLSVLWYLADKQQSEK